VRQLDALLHERLAVDIRGVALVGPDQLFIGAMREHVTVEPINDDVEIAVDEFAALVAESSASRRKGSPMQRATRKRAACA
jgi:hypothetical protein